MPGENEKKISVSHVIIIVLLLFIIWKLHNTGEKLKEGQYVGYGLDRYLYTSGATLRRLGQVFSQPGQGVQTTVYNAERRTDPKQLSAQGIPVVMYLDSGSPYADQANGMKMGAANGNGVGNGNLYTAINNSNSV